MKNLEGEEPQNGDLLDELTAVFTEFMDVDDNGEPVVPYKSLGKLLKALRLPETPIESLDEDGQIKFEPFVNQVFPLLELRDLPADSEEQVAAQRNAFYMLSGGEPEISRASLLKQLKPLGLSFTEADVEQMCPERVTKVEFVQLWRRVVAGG